MNFVNTKLITLLKTLTEEEWREARWFLEAPTKKSRQAMLRCFDELHLSFVKGVAPSKQAVFAVTFPNKGLYDDLALRRLMSELSQTLEEYFAWRQLQVDGNALNHLLFQALAQRKVGDLFVKKINALVADLEKSPLTSASDLAAASWLLSKVYFHPATNKWATGLELITKASAYGDAAFAIQSLCYRLELLERQRLLGEPLPESLLLTQPGFMLAFRHLTASCPAIGLLLQLIALFENAQCLDGLPAALATFHACEDKLGDFEWSLCLNVLTNFAITLSNNGGVDEHRQLFRLQQSRLKRQLAAQQHAPMSVDTYLNIYFTACRAQEFDQALAFKASWSHCLPDAERASTLNLCEAFHLFHRGLHQPKHRHSDFNKARQMLVGLSDASMAFQLRLRPLELLLFYESPQEIPDQTLLSAAKSYERFLLHGSNKGEQWRKRFLDFLPFLRQLVKLRSLIGHNLRSKMSQSKGAPTISQKVLAMESGLREADQVAFKDWLLEKVQELKDNCTSSNKRD